MPRILIDADKLIDIEKGVENCHQKNVAFQ